MEADLAESIVLGEKFLEAGVAKFGAGIEEEVVEWAAFMPLPEQHAEARLAAAREASAESSWRLQHALLVSSSGFGEMVQQRQQKCRWREREAA